ncbi:MAG TPA: single-stranded-DNA-specific exonuclease RecJ [Baekduia sp.]|nr:single-stranded-DNA-specific exonuclease RecJ [Baekduia sp.]
MEPRLQIDPVASADVFALERDLGCSSVLAQVLARRGLTDAQAATEFLDGAERHSAAAFAGIDDAVSLVRTHIADGARITIHGDYDVDGVSATAIMVGALRELGADVDWFIPGRQEDGYGLSAGTVERLHERGTRLLITVDCGIASVDEVARATELGMHVVVTDHHRPANDGRLPSAPILHPEVSGYPCGDLCGAGVAHKFVEALTNPARADQDLDLVALATVADCVPLIGENRRLVRSGLRSIANTVRPGLRALMKVADVDPSRLDATSIAFRLAPRINAAGRMHRADAGVELMLTDSATRGLEIAEQLDARNGERRHAEQRMRFEAEAQVAEQGDRMAYVLAGDDWHPGIIGIVAARVAERFNRPAVLIAFDGDTGTASGRSIPGFDLLAGLQASADHLLRYGGHRAAAGAGIERARLDAFRAAFEAHAATTLKPEDLVPVQRADAVVSGDELGTDLAEELGRLAPFGIGNPPVSLLVPAARLTDRQTMGDGKHLRFNVESGGVRARAVAFGTTKLPEAELVDATFSLELNEFRGAVEPRLILKGARPTQPAAITIVGEPAPGTPEWTAAVTTPNQGFAAVSGPDAQKMQPIDAGEPRDRRGSGIAGTITSLVLTGESVLVVAGDAATRARHLDGRLGGFDLISWAALEHDPGLASRYQHAVALDPPLHPDQLAVISGPVVHLAWGDDELHFVHGLLGDRAALRGALAALYRSLRADGLGAVNGPAWQVRRLLAILVELGLAETDGSIAGAAEKRDLEQSHSFRQLAARHEEGLKWLSAAMPRAA